MLAGCRLRFSKMTKIGFKIPPILVGFFFKAVLKVYLLFWVRAELAETFTIARTFNYLKFGLRKPLNLSMGARNRGISKIPTLKLNLKLKVAADGAKNDVLPD